jgi:hypothetical protein
MYTIIRFLFYVTSALSSESGMSTKYMEGFSECTSEVVRYLTATDVLHADTQLRLLGHLTNCLQGADSNRAAAASPPPHLLHHHPHTLHQSPAASGTPSLSSSSSASSSSRHRYPVSISDPDVHSNSSNALPATIVTSTISATGCLRAEKRHVTPLQRSLRSADRPELDLEPMHKIRCTINSNSVDKPTTPSKLQQQLPKSHVELLGQEGSLILQTPLITNSDVINAVADRNINSLTPITQLSNELRITTGTSNTQTVRMRQSPASLSVTSSVASSQQRPLQLLPVRLASGELAYLLTMGNGPTSSTSTPALAAEHQLGLLTTSQRADNLDLDNNDDCAMLTHSNVVYNKEKQQGLESPVQSPDDAACSPSPSPSLRYPSASSKLDLNFSTPSRLPQHQSSFFGSILQPSFTSSLTSRQQLNPLHGNYGNYGNCHETTSFAGAVDTNNYSLGFVLGANKLSEYGQGRQGILLAHRDANNNELSDPMWRPWSPHR